MRTNASSFKTRDFDGATAKKEALAAAPKCAFIPFTSSLMFEQNKLAGCAKKLLETNAELNILEEKEIPFFNALVKYLSDEANWHS